MIDTQRRILLKGSLAAGAIGVVGAGLFSPRVVQAAWPEAAFSAESVDGALKELFGTSSLETSRDVKINVSEFVHAPFPVTVKCDLHDISSISIFATGNQRPLVASFDLGEGALGYVTTRIRMAKTAQVIAVVKTGDRLLSAAKEVKVTDGDSGDRPVFRHSQGHPEHPE
jgi:sulfur-oxidizing protein SoxY